MNNSAIFSKTGKGVQEASGKTSHLSRADRAVLSAIDGKTNLGEVAKKFEKMPEAKFDALIHQLDKDGFIREVSSGSQSAPAPRVAPTAAKAPPAAKPSSEDSSDGLDFTQVMKVPPKLASGAPKPPPMDLAAAARAEAERKAQDQSLDFRARQEAEQKAKAAAEAKAKAEAEAKARAAVEAAARAEAEAKARAEAEAKTRADADAKVKAAREAAVRMATEAKAKAEAEARAKSEAVERDKARLEAELNAKLEAERKAREDAERRAAEAADRARKELEEKAKRDAEELRQRLEAEMKAKLEEERKAREAEDRKRREEEERRRKEEDERRAKEDAERRAKEDAERKKREEEDRRRREEDERRRKEEDERRRKEEDERRAREDAERRAREDADRKKREEEDRKRKEEDERRRREEGERREKEDRRRKEEDERRARDEAERKAKAAAEASASLPKIEPVAPPPAAKPAGELDDLLGDLESFGKREEEEQKAKEEAERKAKEAAERKAKEAAERKAKEEADKKRREEEERRRKEEEERRAREEEERKERKEREEEERRKEEEAERKRKAKEEVAAKQAEERAAKAAAQKAAAKGDDDLDVGEEEADTDDIKRDQKALAGRVAARQREQASVVVSAKGGRPRKWGKPAAIALFVVLVGGLGAINLMPVSTGDYEKAAAEAMGVPVKIGSARMSVLTGIEMKFDNVAIGDSAKIRLVRGFPEFGSLFGGRKAFSRIELEGVSASQAQIADAVLGKVSGANLQIGRVTVKQLSLEGPLKLPPLDVEAEVGGSGGFQTVKLTGGDKIQVQLSPAGNDIAFEISAGSLALPFVPALTLLDFGMKGTANRAGMTATEFDGRIYDGVISGNARIRWGANWTVEGDLRARALKAAVFAPALVSEGRVEGKGSYSMSGRDPAALGDAAHVQGEFTIEKGVLGSFDLTRALQTGGAQAGGRTVFNELTGQGVYDKGAVQLRNVAIAAGAMNANASLDIDANGGLSGRVAADVKTPTQTLRATVTLSGKVQDPVIRK